MKPATFAQAGLQPTVKGHGLAKHTFACARCGQAAEQQGSGYRHVLGCRMHVCAKCKESIDARRSRPQFPSRLARTEAAR